MPEDSSWKTPRVFPWFEQIKCGFIVEGQAAQIDLFIKLFLYGIYSFFGSM